ncbi:GtrA family protein [Paraburkholderia sp. GAS42]|uniref:GtrA family protein n=1 Tax=Paraburkholderia sp. GAS42 TaxID=3035135 RepID=UPI003D21B918
MRTADQLVRFAIVGVASNAVLYMLYLAATEAGVEHKGAMTGVFALGILQTFLFNKNWSFRDRSTRASTFVRYMIAYSAAYGINLVAMLVLVDRYHFPDRGVQAVMIIVVALFLFAALRFWVFPASRRSFAEQE